MDVMVAVVVAVVVVVLVVVVVGGRDGRTASGSEAGQGRDDLGATGGGRGGRMRRRQFVFFKAGFGVEDCMAR